LNTEQYAYTQSHIAKDSIEKIIAQFYSRYVIGNNYGANALNMPLNNQELRELKMTRQSNNVTNVINKRNPTRKDLLTAHLLDSMNFYYLSIDLIGQKKLQGEKGQAFVAANNDLRSRFFRDITREIDNAIISNAPSNRAIQSVLAVFDEAIKATEALSQKFDGSSGTYQALKQLERRGFGSHVLIGVSDGKICGDCAALEGSIYTSKTPITGIIGAGIHPRCRCVLVPLDVAFNMNYNSANDISDDISNDKKATFTYDETSFASPSSLIEPRTEIHNDISRIRQQYRINNSPVWTTDKLMRWQLIDSHPDAPFIRDFKMSWIYAYKDVINDAAERYGIPLLLLAGVAYVEVAGDPMWIDPLAFHARRINERMFGSFFGGLAGRDAVKTSYGNISMQIIVAAETLGYDINNLNDAQINNIIRSLNDPIQNIYISAKHLSELRDIDFIGTGANDMSEEQIAITAERYNRGGAISIDSIINNSNGYGGRIMRMRDYILEALR